LNRIAQLGEVQFTMPLMDGDKDAEIAELKRQLKAKDRTIATLRKQLQTQKK